MTRPRTFVEKILDAPAGTIVFREPDLVLSHDNTASIRKTFEKMNGRRVKYPERLLIVLDHNAPPTNASLANDYQAIRELVREQGIVNFYDAGRGICHQIMAGHARPGMIIVGSDSHTCTAGAFNALAAGIDRTETAGIWHRGETWFRVPETMRVELSGRLQEGVYAKDLSLWLIGMIGSAGANYMSVEFHGNGLHTLDMADRMTVANLASEMGAKNAVFPAPGAGAVWADEGAVYAREVQIRLDDVVPLVAAPHHVDNIKNVDEVSGLPVQQGLIGTCTNGRLEDIRVAAAVLRGKQVFEGFQLLVIPASREIYLQAIREGLITDLVKAGANVLTSSCGPCLGTGQGIPADGIRVISTANRNFLGRMGNKKAEIYLASPAVVAESALAGEITLPQNYKGSGGVPYEQGERRTVIIADNENRRHRGVWNYADADNLNTDLMFAGHLTYSIKSSDPEAIIPYLFHDFDPCFAASAQSGDVIIAGDNFGCGSSREHPAVGLAQLGIRAVIVKSVNRIFFRSAINQGLLLIVHPGLVEAYRAGDRVEVDLRQGQIVLNDRVFAFAPLPGKLQEIIASKGLVNWIRDK